MKPIPITIHLKTGVSSAILVNVGLPRLPDWNPRPLYLSLLIGLGAVTLVQMLCSLGMLPEAIPSTLLRETSSAISSTPSSTTGCNSDVLVLLPLALGMAWVSLAVEPRAWRGIVLAGAALQLALATLVSARYGKSFNAVTPALSLLLACAVPELLRLRARNDQIEALDYEFQNEHRLDSVTLEEEKAGEEYREEKRLASSQFLGTHESAQTLPVSSVTDSTPDTAEPSLAPIRVNSTVLHCSLINHAQLAESLQPSQFAFFLKRLLALCEETTHAYMGVTDRADGEAFRAVFSPLLGAEEHPEAALQAAAAIRQRLLALSHECEIKFGHELDLRLGVSTGEVLLTTVGTPVTRICVGETADWAQKLAQANTLYGSRILISARTGLLGGHSVERRPIDLLQRQLPPHPPEEVFELVALQNTLDSETMARLARYRKGVAQFRARRWDAARALLISARPQENTDEAIELLLQRIAENEARVPVLNRAEGSVGRR